MKQIILSLLLYSLCPFLLNAQLPSRMDLTPFCPIPGNQGVVQSCTGWAVGYAAMTITKAIQNQQTNRRFITENAFSALFIYHQINGGKCQRGATIEQALRLVQQKGNCYAKQFDRFVNNCRQQPGRGQFQKALAHQIHSKTLFNNKTHTPNKVLAVKRHLAQQMPVIISLQVFENFYALRSNSSYWWPTQGNRTPAGGHALVVVGYDDRKQAFQLMNSMGTQWGSKGFVWLKYTYFEQLCRGAFVIGF